MKYLYLWEKYRPAILNLMVASSKGPQEYKLSSHEFTDLSPKKTTGYTFTLKFQDGKVINNIKTSALAQDLLAMLRNSAKALSLSETAIYQFKLSKDFVLNISREEVLTESEPETPSNDEQDQDHSED